MSEGAKQMLVYADWEPFPQPTLMGTLSSLLLRGEEVFSFEYDKNWLNQNAIQILDPDLQFYAGPQHLRSEKINFGLFLDSSPDRWGRLIIKRREAALARKEGRKENRLQETDFLLGVYDQHRMGGIRFKTNEDGPFLNDNKEMAAPPFSSLRELQHASSVIENEDITAPDYLKWINLLIAPGSSLGGARPKASVIDPQEQLWIAKFPSKYDDKDIGAWEKVAHDLAVAAGINMSKAILMKFNSRHHTFLAKRFDRSMDKRIHFASAMTMLGLNDGADHHDGVSYLHLAEFIIRNGAHVDRDLEELWRRIVFNICISNTDDHLRNHGFLLTQTGWALSPAYDLNPNETGFGLKLNISENDNALDIDLAMQVIPYFRISEARAKEIITTVHDAVQNWREVATNCKISRNEQIIMEGAFHS
jgi:serine/threonine-protein kinase HipA